MISNLAERLAMAELPCELDELMKQQPELQTMRVITADSLRARFERLKKTCTWCGADCRGQRTRWCSQECVRGFESRCHPSAQARLVQLRDHDICQQCGLDTSESAARWREHQGTGRPRRDQPELAIKYGWGRGRWAEVDHIIPVVLGGGLCRLSNLRVLCGACHASETAELAARRARLLTSG